MVGWVFVFGLGGRSSLFRRCVYVRVCVCVEMSWYTDVYPLSVGHNETKYVQMQTEASSAEVSYNIHEEQQ